MYACPENSHKLRWLPELGAIFFDSRVKGTSSMSRKALVPESRRDSDQVYTDARAKGEGAPPRAKSNNKNDQIVRMSIQLAESTHFELAKRAAKEKVTITFLINQALKDGGYKVPESALVTDGRRRAYGRYTENK